MVQSDVPTHQVTSSNSSSTSSKIVCIVRTTKGASTQVINTRTSKRLEIKFKLNQEQIKPIHSLK